MKMKDKIQEIILEKEEVSSFEILCELMTQGISVNFSELNDELSVLMSEGKIEEYKSYKPKIKRFSERENVDDYWLSINTPPKRE